MKKRSFKELSNTITTSELDKFCKRIAESYANSEARFARSYYTIFFVCAVFWKSCF